MRWLGLAIAAFVSAVGFAPPAWAGLILAPISGDGALEAHFQSDPFSPNNTSPQLQITGAGSVENSGGVAIFGSSAAVLDIQFLGAYGNESKPSYEKLLLTAAFRPDEPGFGGIRFFDPEEPSQHVDIPAAAFADAEAFGLIFPADGIRGIGDGAGDFLSLDGALVAGVDLGIGLERDGDAALPPMASVGVQILAPEPGMAVRFDVFGLNDTDATGWNIQGNNPNSGAAGIVPPPDGPEVPASHLPEPGTMFLFGSAVAVLITMRRRKDRAGPR